MPLIDPTRARLHQPPDPKREHGLAMAHTRRFQTHHSDKRALRCFGARCVAMRCLLLAVLSLQEGRPPQDMLRDRAPAYRFFGGRHGFASTSPKALSRMLGGAFGDRLFWRSEGWIGGSHVLVRCLGADRSPWRRAPPAARADACILRCSSSFWQGLAQPRLLEQLLL